MIAEPEELLAHTLQHLRERDRDAAARTLAALLDAEDRSAVQWDGVARIAVAIGELALARTALERHLGRSPSHVEHRLTAAGIWAKTGDAETALATLRIVEGNGASDARVAHLIGTLQSQLGDFQAARRSLDQALRMWPNSGHSWLSLAAIHRYGREDPELARIEAAAPALTQAPADVRAAYLYALGKARDDAGLRAPAFDAFASGAALMKASSRYDARADRAHVEALVRGFDAATVQSLKWGGGVAGDRAIFVTGLPRSGTTLVEQMLSAHPDIAGGAELNLFQHVIRLVGGSAADAQDFAARSGGAASAWARAAGMYHHLLEQRFPQAGRVVDKTLTASRMLGLAALVLPNAPLVWVRRDPADIGWSCYRTFFAEGVAWSWSLEDIAQHIALEDRLLGHWQAVLGDRLLILDYEALIDAPEQEAARLLAHCGLAPADLSGFHKVERAVGTSSLAQVRQPLYRGSVGAASRYAEQLAPFHTAYAQARMSLGLSPTR